MHIHELQLLSHVTRLALILRPTFCGADEGTFMVK